MRLRLVTINFWGTTEPLRARLDLAIRQLRELRPDVIGMQEVRPLDGVSGRTTADEIADALGMNAVYERSLAWKDDDFFPGHPGGQEGLAILSKYPVAEHRVTGLPEARPTEARILLSASLHTPVGESWVHTTHLHWRLADGLARERQVTAIDEVVRDIGSERPQLLCGDFNAIPDSDEIRFMRGLTTLAGRRTHYQDAWLRLHPPHLGTPGWTWAMTNPNTGPMRSIDIDRRIDYVFVTNRKKDGRGTIHECRVVLDEVDGDVCASDHYGVLAEVELGEPLIA